MAKGTVKWFDPEKKYGFITSDDGKQEFFVHISEIVGQVPLENGEIVEFEIGEGKKGPTAVSVQSVQGE